MYAHLQSKLQVQCVIYAMLTIAYNEATDSSPIFIREVLVGFEIAPRSNCRFKDQCTMWQSHLIIPVNLAALCLPEMRGSIGF